MKRRLYVLRHSKAGQTNKRVLDDHGRGLTKKGVTFCQPIAKYLLSLHRPPELVLCSSAVRARETAEHVLELVGKDIPVEQAAKLYLSGVSDIFSIVNGIDPEISTALIVGHNPGLQQFCVMLAGTGDKKKFRVMKNNFPPPSMAVFDIAAPWSGVSVQSGELLDFVTAKSLM